MEIEKDKINKKNKQNTQTDLYSTYSGGTADSKAIMSNILDKGMKL